MNLRLKDIEFPNSKAALAELRDGLLLINTINAHSYNVARKDAAFAEALLKSDVLIPDGASVVWAKRWLPSKQSPPKRIGINGRESRNKKTERIAGWDLFEFEMNKLQTINNGQLKRALFLGSTEAVLAKIKARAAVEYPNVEVHTYSPPYKPEFSNEDNEAMFTAIHAVNPDVLFIGMTAPKQEKWAYRLVNSQQFTVYSKEKIEEMYSNDTTNYKLSTINSKLNCHVCCIGAVFDFYAGTVKRAPLWWQEHSLEWLYRLIKEPRRMWRRYLVGNTKFIFYIVLEKFSFLNLE